MKITTKLLKIFLISFLALGFTKDSKKPVGKITFILGSPSQVNILRTDQNNWTNAELFSQVCNGDKIKTQKESRCEIRLNDRSNIRIGENTTFRLKQDSDGLGKDSQLSLGRIWFNIKSLLKKETFSIKTPTAVCSIRGTIFRMDADSTTRIAVYDGAVDVGPVGITQEQLQQQQKPTKSLKPYEVPGPSEIPPPFEVTLDQWVHIVKGYQIEIRNDGKYAKSKIDETEDSKSEWIKWNAMRDKMTE